MRLSRLAFGISSVALIALMIGAYLTHEYTAMFGLMFVLQALAVFRLHDIGMSGWWSALFTTVNMVLFFYLFANMFSEAHIGHIYTALALIGIVFLAQILVLYVRRGTSGPNRFGPDPASER